ncbi:type II secretion system secretin GspD [Arhodomonas aquaeolei]|uniref:type II secretion system secretin GspD n=1 Tax=Arhodomonas TaxID=2368 RepID=UPI0013D05568|nr:MULTISPECIES: type II secretion system secretin GspD [Arhodomonas]MCS4502977.1 type II secretion system secretin GspD [Arhodomonas aquaeolei]
MLLALVTVLAAGTAGAQEQITLNLKDAQLSALVDTVAEVTGRNFVLDPRVNARVTVISRRPMDADALYQVFLSILQVHGFSAIPAGEVTKIVPDVNARQLGGEDGEDTGDAVVTRVLTVENVPVAQLVPILRPLVPQQGHFAAYAPTNSLIISDHASNVARIADVVRKVDRAGAAATEVIPLEHATAETAAETLGEVLGGQGEEAGAQAVRVAADKRTNALVVMGTDAQRARVRRLVERLDAGADQGGDTRVVYLSYAKAEDVAEVLQSVSENLPSAATDGGGDGEGGAAGAGGSGKTVSIQADAATNSLVISAPPAVQNELAAVIDKLDIRRAQVLIEAAIAEVSADMAAELGFQWAVDGGNGNTAVGGTSFGNNSVSGGDSLAGIIGSLSQQEIPNIGSGLSLAVGDLAGGVRFAALLRALASDADTNILSTPSLVTLDNQEAEITVAQNVPFVTGSYTTASSDSSNVNPFQTIERRDVGLILKVKPQINEGDSVMLEIQQEVSNVSESTRAVDLITDKRSISTSVLVDSGRLVVLGGLLDEQVRETEQRVPLLGSIPVLGNLFRYRSAQSEKRNLMVFLRPRIVRDEATMTRYASDKYASMRERQRAQRDAGVALLPDDVAPVLPPLGRPALPAPFTRGR